MNTLTIRYHAQKLDIRAPHRILIDGHQLGVMQSNQFNVQSIPQGSYRLTIQSMLPFISASADINIHQGENEVVFRNRETLWDIIFAVDLVLWVVKLFLTLPPTLNLWYEIITNGYFAFWLIYEWLIRKKYFDIRQK